MTQEISALLLTSSVVAAFLTAAMNVAIAIANRRGQKELERFKKSQEFLVKRFERLSALRDSILDLPVSVPQDELIRAHREGDEKVITKFAVETHAHYTKIRKLFHRNKYYFDEDLRTAIEDQLQEVQSIIGSVQKLVLEKDPEKDVSHGERVWEIAARAPEQQMAFQQDFKKRLEQQLERVWRSLL